MTINQSTQKDTAICDAATAEIETTAKRCVIVGGADINNYGRIKANLKDSDYFIYCDCGLRHEKGLEKAPSLIVGDFDSYSKPDTEIEMIVLPCEKDDTDTVYAVKEGIKRGYTRFLIIGAVGARLDHTLGNVYILEMLDKQGLHGVILDDYSEMELVSGDAVYIDSRFSYFSLLNITGKAKGIYVSNAKYSLTNGEIECGYQYGISNEVLPEKEAKVYVTDGKLLVIKVV